MFETVKIDPAIKKLWEEEAKNNSPELDQFLDHAVEVAKEYFPKAESK